MRLMLDTHTLIWFLNGDPKLSQKAKHAIENPDNLKIVSIASIWEIAIKLSLNKFKFSKGFKSFLELIDKNGFAVLPITFDHALTVSKLEFIHRDPFDRLLISQCITDNLKVVSKDEYIAKYDIETLW
jgi:PIN domain nuclease of toxin-antitoxin system